MFLILFVCLKADGAKHSSWFWHGMANDVFLTLQRKYIQLVPFSKNWSRIQVIMSDIDFVPTRMMLELSESVIQLKFEFHYVSEKFRSSSKCWLIFWKFSWTNNFSQFHEGSISPFYAGSDKKKIIKIRPLGAKNEPKQNWSLLCCVVFVVWCVVCGMLWCCGGMFVTLILLSVVSACAGCVCCALLYCLVFVFCLCLCWQNSAENYLCETMMTGRVLRTSSLSILLAEWPRSGMVPGSPWHQKTSIWMHWKLPESLKFFLGHFWWKFS